MKQSTCFMSSRRARGIGIGLCCVLVLSPLLDSMPHASAQSTVTTINSQAGKLGQRPALLGAASNFLASLLTILQGGGGPPSVPGTGLPDLDAARQTQPAEPVAPPPIVSGQACTDCTPCPTCGPGTLNHAPVVSPGGPYSGTAGTTTTFNGLSSFDVDSGDGISDYAWGFGDNTAVVVHSAMPTHTYQTGGTYTVSLTVTDRHNTTSSASTTAAIAAAPAPAPSPTSTQGNSATFISQSVPNMMAGRGVYDVSVTMRNTGSTTWSAAHLYRLGSQNAQDNGIWGKNRVYLQEAVLPGATVTINFTVVAPAAELFVNEGMDEGVQWNTPYNFQWQMVQDGVQWFGELSQNQVVEVPAEPDSSGYLGPVSQDGLADIGSARWEPRNRTGQPGEDLLSGNFNGSLSLLSLAGRSGLDLSLSLAWNSLVWTRINPVSNRLVRHSPHPYMTYDADRGSPAPGFRLGFPTIQGPFFNAQANADSYLLLMSSGTRVELRRVSDSNVYESVDSSYLQLLDGGNGSMLLRSPDGSQMSYWSINNEYHCTEIKDTNGNFITIKYDPINGTANLGRMTAIIDTLGRTINFNYDINYRLQTITQSWNGGQTHTWVTFGYADLSLQTNFKDESGTTMALVGVPSNQTLSVLTQVGLDDGSRYNFDYSSWGQVYRIKRYAADGHQLSSTTYNLPLTNSTEKADCPRFTQRQDWAENWNNDQPVTTSFEFDASGQWGQITSAAGTADQVSYREYSTKEYSDWVRGLVTSTEIRDAGGNLKKTTVTAWAQDLGDLPYALNPRPKRVTISDPAGNRRRTSYEYTSFGLPIDVFEQGPLGTNDWAILRRTHTDYNLSPAYVNRHILDLVQGQYLFAPDAPNSPSVQTLMSKATYEYDVDTGICTGLCADYATAANNPSIVQHDGVNFGSAFRVGRAALTRMRRWDANAETDETRSITSSVHYDVLGSAIRTSDALDHRTTINYSDQFSADGLSTVNPVVITMAYPTLLTDPDGFSASAKYDYDLGVATRTQDPKSAAQITSYDHAGRIKRVTNAVNGAYVRWGYPANMTLVTQFTTIKDLNTEAFSAKVLDGAGRVRASALDFPDTTPHYSAQYTSYDIYGRVVLKSNSIEVTGSWIATGPDAPPHGFGWVFEAQSFDWKGRPLIITHTDGSTKEASYDGCGCAGGDAVTLKDEGTVVNGELTRRQQRVHKDPLGRDVKAETFNWDGSVYATSTSTYNALDQTTVQRRYQGSNSSNVYQDTIMSYDGFGRLKTKHDPEQQVDPANSASLDHSTWVYNTDDTIQKVIDPRGVIKNISYNNRRLVTGINYDISHLPATAQVSQTAGITFGYDETGKRTSMQDGLGTATYHFDNLSRMDWEERYLSALGNNYHTSYSYNTGGQLIGITDPFNAQVGYVHDAIGRVTAVTGSGFGNVSTYASNLQYRAWGVMKHLTYGNGRNLETDYDARLEVSSFSVTGIMSVAYQHFADGHLSYAHDLLDQRFDRSFSYDQADRMIQARSGAEARGEPATNDRPYNQTFSFDAFGNMTGRAGKHWRRNLTPFSSSFSNNRQLGVTYDASGHETASSTSNSTFDAAGQLFQTTGPTRRNNPTLILMRNYDGDGQEIQNTQYGLTTFLIRSSVLGGAAVAEIYGTPGQPEFGQKRLGHVYVNGKQLAEQNTYLGVPFYKHYDPGGTKEGTSFTHPDATVAYGRIELDPIRDDVGYEDPYGVEPGDSDPGFTFPDFGDLSDFAHGCTIDGQPVLCTFAFEYKSAMGIGSLGMMEGIGAFFLKNSGSGAGTASSLRGGLSSTPLLGRFCVEVSSGEVTQKECTIESVGFTSDSYMAAGLSLRRSEPLVPDHLKTIEQSRNDVLQILGSDNACSSFFGGTAQAVEVFNQIKFAAGEVEVPGNTAAENARIGIRTVTEAYSRPFPPTRVTHPANATVNTAGGFFRVFYPGSNKQLPGFGSYGTNNRQARALMMLHELAHLIRKADGSDWLIKDDNTSADTSETNTETVEKACKEQLDAIE